MPKKVGFLKKLQKSKKKQLIFFLVIMIGLVAIYLPIETKIRDIREKEILGSQNIVEDYNILANIESVEIKNEKMILSGWALRLNSKNSNIHIVLQAIDNSDTRIFDTYIEEDNKVGQKFTSDWDFGACRFIATKNASKLQDNVCYEVLVVLDYIQEMETKEIVEYSKKVTTGKYLYDGELYSYNPINYTEPKVTDEELLQVIEEGILRAYDSEMQIWVYQCGLKLYYIVNPPFGSMELNQIGIPVMLRTNQPELLPEHRVQYGFDHIGFYYENIEYQREGVLPYQVIVVTLSEKYPITYLATGLYNIVNEQWVIPFKIWMMD